MQAAEIKYELANELHGKFAYVEAIKLYEEARDMFVQVYLTVAVLNTVMAAVAPLLLSCCTAKCYMKACHRRHLPQATVSYAQAVQGARGGRVDEDAKSLVLPRDNC
jgi:hypothetical protein